MASEDRPPPDLVHRQLNGPSSSCHQPQLDLGRDPVRSRPLHRNGDDVARVHARPQRPVKGPPLVPTREFEPPAAPGQDFVTRLDASGCGRRSLLHGLDARDEFASPSTGQRQPEPGPLRRRERDLEFRLAIGPFHSHRNAMPVGVDAK